ncbi:xylan 1,4-beta-xylosidase [Spirillospora sp. NPDC047279]|uniref:GH39 family glycosyl hydrolase n=1 Tax=Spirillospora sp. NPDC047279 TaxID=3155478 RepID=UPI0033DE91CD
MENSTRQTSPFHAGPPAGTRTAGVFPGSRRRTILIALGFALAGLLIATTMYAVMTRQSGVRVGGNAPESWPAWGFTQTQNSDVGQQAPAVRAALRQRPVVQAQAIMGWGADNPQPAPGPINFASLDRRIQLIRDTKGTPSITLCCAPDWMKGGPAGTTDWSRLEMAPVPERFDDFAKLAAEVARRYPDVKHYTVWNEFKGFWNPQLQRWDYEGYTTFYNKVYTALKNVDEDIKVGGPYMAMNSDAPGYAGPKSEVRGSWGSLDQRAIDAVRYWMKHKEGADFMVVDGHTFPVQREIRPNEFALTAKFADVTRWLRTLDGDLPIWWAEWYIEPDASGWTEQRRRAVQAVAMMEFVRGGASTALYWDPQTTGAGACAGCLWPSATDANGGRPTPVLELLQNFSRWFKPGSRLAEVTSSNRAVRVLAQDDRMLAVNTTDRQIKTEVDGDAIELGPYEVRWTKR